MFFFLRARLCFYFWDHRSRDEAATAQQYSRLRNCVGDVNGGGVEVGSAAVITAEGRRGGGRNRP